MKITKEYLKQLIKESVHDVVAEYGISNVYGNSDDGEDEGTFMGKPVSTVRETPKERIKYFSWNGLVFKADERTSNAFLKTNALPWNPATHVAKFERQGKDRSIVIRDPKSKRTVAIFRGQKAK